jgi:hypothetical protein
VNAAQRAFQAIQDWRIPTSLHSEMHFSKKRSNLRADNVAFYRLEPDDFRIDFAAVWRKKEPSVVLKSFLDLLDEELPAISRKTRIA